MVELGSYRRGALPEVRYTRLDEHYRHPVELARLIIENSSLELLHGEVTGAGFLIDMNKVFERFLYVALGEALCLPERQWKQGAGLTLDEDRRISMNPDLSWWPPIPAENGSRPIFVGDAKYKKLETLGSQNADIYQMLAYCTAADLPSGLWFTLPASANQRRTRSGTRARRLRSPRWTSGAHRKPSSTRSEASPTASRPTPTRRPKPYLPPRVAALRHTQG